MVDTGDTGLELLTEAAEALALASDACESPEDAAHFSALAARVRRYLAASSSTTALGMPRIPSTDNELTHDAVIHRSSDVPEQSHVRLLPN